MQVDYSHGLDKGQRTQRRSVRLEDQFGRLWGCSIEKSTGDPCTSINPFGGWADPLGTPNAYLRIPKHDDGTPRSGRIVVDFDRWIASVQGSMDDWNRLLEVAGKMEYRVYTAEERKKWRDDPILRAHAGPEPTPSVETLKKAQAGDKDLLGLNAPKPVIPQKQRNRVSDWADFVQSMKGQGYSPKELGELYREGKNLVPA